MTRLQTLLGAEACRKLKAPLQRGWTLPPAAYTQPDVFNCEVEHIFRKDWICVGRVEQLPNPGDYVCLDFFNQPIVVARDMRGELHAMSSICLHRAMPIASGQGNCTRFVCPYHHWTYELNGALRSAPMMDGAEGFDPQSCRLPQLQLEVWHGFIFVNADPEAKALAPQISALEPLIEDYEFENVVVAESLYFDSPWNWKLLVENFMEAYHHIGPHKNTFEPIYPARNSVVEDNHGQPWSFLRMPGLPLPSGEPTSFPNLPEDRRHELFAAAIFPSFLFAASSGSGAWYQLQPRGAGAMDLHIHALMHKDIAAQLDDDARAGTREFLTVIHTEDISVNAGPWRGLQAPMTRQGRLSLFEKAIWQLNQYWAQRLEL